MISENSLHLFSAYKGNNKRKYSPIRATRTPKIFVFIKKERKRKKQLQCVDPVTFLHIFRIPTLVYTKHGIIAWASLYTETF